MGKRKLESEGSDPSEAEPKPRKQSAKAKALLKPISEKSKTSTSKDFTVEVSLIGRCNPGVRKVLDRTCRIYSQVAQIASRLALYLVCDILQDENLSQVEQIESLKPLCAGKMQSLYKDCMNKIAGSGRPKLVKDDKFRTFCDEFRGTIPQPAVTEKTARIIESIASTMVKDTTKMIKERMDTKIKLWMKHQIRKASWDSLKSTMKVDEAKRWVHSLSLDIYKSVWKDEPYMPPKDLTEDLKRTSRDVYDKVRGWLELYRPGGEKELEVIKAKPPPPKKKSKGEPKERKISSILKLGLTAASFADSSRAINLWILHQINCDLAADGEHRRVVCQEHPGSSKEAKAARVSAIRRLPYWQQNVPASFTLLPQKKAHAVDFLHVSASVSENMLLQLPEISPEHSNTDFWWRDLIQLDDLGWEGADSEVEYAQKEKERCRGLLENPSGYCFRASRRACMMNSVPGRKPSGLARINGLALSQAHFNNMLNRREWYRDKGGNPPCYPVVLTGFRTNGRELHLILQKISHPAGTQGDAFVSRQRVHGFDVLDKRGFSNLGDEKGTEKGNKDEEEDNEDEEGKGKVDHNFDLNQKAGIFTQSSVIHGPTRVTVVDPGQIHPLAYATADVGVDPVDNDKVAQSVHFETEQDFHAVRGTEPSDIHKNWDEVVLDTKWKEDARDTKRQWEEYIEQFKGKSPHRSDGAQILNEKRMAHLSVEGRNWKKIEVLLNGHATETTTMTRRDLAWKRKRMRKRWIRDWALKHKRKGVQLLCYGNGGCWGRGHRKVPTKQIIRNAANIIPVLVLDEWGTSSRCPNCRSPDKLERKTIEEQNPPDETTAPQVSQGGNEAMKEMEPDKDLRVERCTHCERVWKHDEVSVVNLVHVARAVLLKEERPKWLQRKRKID